MKPRGFTRGPLVVSGALVFVVGLALSAQAKNELAGTYEVASSEGLRGFLYVREDLVVRRRFVLPDKTYRTQIGRGTLEGDKLTVTFTGSGDPHELAGEWAVTGEAEVTGRYRGTALFAKNDERWTTTFVANDLDDGDALPSVEIGGTLTATTFTGERNGVAVVYSLSQDGLALASKTETFKRSSLPLNGGPTATYTFETTGRVTGKLSTGVTDKGARALLKTAGTATTEELTRLPIEADPVPNSLRATRDTKILLGPTGPEGKAVKKDELVHVCGRQGDLWVVGPFKDASGKKWRGFLKDDDLNPRLHYKAVDAPIFLPGKRPNPSSILQKDLGTCYFDAALMAISEHHPQLIEAMFRDLKDGSVAVRFYVKDEHGRFVEHWVRVKRTIVVDDKGRSHYTIGEGGQLWPALAEKAFAAWRGKGYYRNIEGGIANDVFEVVLGRPAKLRTWPLPLPGEIGSNRLKAEIPQLQRPDREALYAFMKTDYWKAEGAQLVNHPSRRRDFTYIEKLLAKVDLSDAGEKLMASYYKARCEGPLGSGRYSATAKELYQLIETTDRAKRPMCLGTKPWGKGGTGQSGGENVELVPGLASSHEYMVLGVSTDDRKLMWVKVRNPWQHFSRRYERKGDELVVTAVDGKKDEGRGVFDVELSDFMRYFGSLSYVTE